MNMDLPAAIFSYLIHESTDAVLIMDAHGNVRYVNDALCRLSGFGPRELIGESINGLLPNDIARSHDRYVEQYLAGTRRSGVLGRTRELALRHRSGATIPIELKAVDIGVVGGIRYFGGFIADLRARKAIETQNTALMQQLEKQALTDALTELPNRRAFELESSRTLAHARRERTPVVVGVADIDRFKDVNDRFGHAAGDAVLRVVARTIQECVRAGDLFGRLGGEEFGLLFPHATLPQAEDIAERLRTHIAKEVVTLGKDKIGVTASIGLANIGTDQTVDAALARADAALYRAKLSGRNRVESENDKFQTAP